MTRLDDRRYWLTPPDLLTELVDRYGVTFDAAPYPRPDGFDGLELPWGPVTYVNPPFDGGATPWINKALAERDAGRTVLFAWPVDRPTLALIAAADEVVNLGDVRWHAVEDGTPRRASGRHTGLFILRPR